LLYLTTEKAFENLCEEHRLPPLAAGLLTMPQRREIFSCVLHVTWFERHCCSESSVGGTLHWWGELPVQLEV